MSLPSSYSAILSDLNREVLRAQPSDPLQFCANWFASRLEHERTQARSNSSPTSASAPPLGPVPSTSSSSGAPASKPKQTALPFNQGYSFGAQPRAVQNDDLQSPFSENPPPAGDPSPFGQDRTSGPTGGSRHIKSGSTVASDAAAASAAARARLPSADNDSDVEDPRDDPNYHPSKAGGPFGPAGAASGPAASGIPAAYNLGRRTSVSAESLDPSASSSLPKTVIPKSPSQRARIETSIANNLLFRNLDEDQHNDVLNAMKEVTVQAGTEVIVQGAVGDFFYVVEEGSFEVWVRGPPTHEYAGPGQSVTHAGEEKKVATYGPGGSFGELALMYNAPRAATVVATSRATMWALDRVTFRSILVEHTSRKRKMYETFLSEVPILQTLNAKERAKIADALEEKVYEEGEAVVIEGEVGKNFYIIESGQAEVTKKRKSGSQVGEEDTLGLLSKGDYFGELALINSAPRAATVRAVPGQGRLRVATLGEKAFTRLLGPIIDILARKAERSYGPGAAVNASLGGGGSGNGGSSFGDQRRSVAVE
ncbi:cAMP-dependent protein kinase regulatory subunit BCY1 [Sporobolomyces koalae]|uniref:cAMP-dependent protein kinase regulatory subunit BCY1 n=1 Tax=Sporobolomyces koalae TaxID=500713 RepID=UPI003180B393